MTYFDAQRERDDALAMEAMNDGEYARAAVNQYASAHGANDPDVAWILSPFDSWEPNPFYSGPPVPHPEDDSAHYCEEFEAVLVPVVDQDDEIPF